MSGKSYCFIASVFALLIFISNPFSTAFGNSCVRCHDSLDFLVTHNKLYDYFQEWTLSIHHQEGVTCDDCHGGNPDLLKKAASHGEHIGKNMLNNKVHFQNIPSTCSECHEHIYKGYTQSAHFKRLVAKDKGAQGPNCVTCHGSINVVALNVNTVKQACGRCHNDKTKNRPQIPQKSELLLNKRLSIQNFYQYIISKGNHAQTKSFFEDVDMKLEGLSMTWHTFNIDKIERKTKSLLRKVKAKRSEVKKGRIKKY